MRFSLVNEAPQRPERALNAKARALFNDAYRHAIYRGASDEQAVEEGYRALEANGYFWGRVIDGAL
jgi:hypothetical protein